MAKIKRNGPCPCGVGNKAKYCCLKERSGTVDSPTRFLSLEVCHDAALDLEHVSRTEFQALFDEMIYLPETDISLQVPLPRLFTPEIDRAISALDDDLRLPWERPRHPAQLTPVRVRRGFRRLGAMLGTPASPPKSTTPGPGRPKGTRKPPRKRYPAVKKAA